MDDKTKDGAPMRAEGEARNGAANEPRVRVESSTRALPDDAVIILPVRSVVLFPGIGAPLAIGRERSRAAAQEAVRLGRPLGLLLQRSEETEEPGPDDLHWVGTTASVVRYVTTGEGHHAIVKGLKRFRVLQF